MWLSALAIAAIYIFGLWWCYEVCAKRSCCESAGQSSLVKG